MANVILVQVDNRGYHLFKIGRRHLFGKSSLYDSVEKFSSFAKFHDYMEVLFVLISSMELDNVGMVDASQNFNLPLQQMKFLSNFIFLNRFNCILPYVCRRLLIFALSSLLSGHSDRPEVSVPDDFSEFVI